MTPLERYHRDLEQPGFVADPAQARAVEHLERVHRELTAAPPRPRRGWLGRVSGWLGRGGDAEPVRGLYLWGGVGRGKTYLMDTFYTELPLAEKSRQHFHRFMQSVHGELRGLPRSQAPLAIIAERFARSNRLLCFDEFFVSDIGDAMILANLLEGLFEAGVTLVATSNTRPDELYAGGLQRDRFLPAIELIKAHTEVLNVDGGEDYRLRFLDRAEIYHHPLDDGAEETLASTFDGVVTGPVARGTEIVVLNRPIPARRAAQGVVWFDFVAVCDGPRSQADYIEIARLHHTVLISGVPVFTRERNDEARRFIELVDEFYDRGVNLVVSAAAAPTELYRGERLAKEFRRTESRLQEMQSHDYLARAHRP